MSELTKRAVAYMRVSTTEQTKTAADDKGYSIHGQEEACQRKAAELGAEIVDAYVERAESAKTADRPELQRMLHRIRTKRDVDYLILYKVDRFARNRIEDGAMLAELMEYGVTLISATENIDDTPEGRMMHGILATFAEYEIAKGSVRSKLAMYQKAKMGGTPGRAPIGYLNVGAMSPDGFEYRTVVVDEERAPHIQWAFRTYATGQYSLDELVDMLEARGLLCKPHKRGADAVPIQEGALNSILRNEYYLGTVIFKGREIRRQARTFGQPGTLRQGAVDSDGEEHVRNEAPGSPTSPEGAAHV